MREKPVSVKQYKLSAETVDIISEEIDKACVECKIDKKIALRYRLSAEECLLRWLEELGDGTEIELEISKKLIRKYIRISSAGKQCNPYMRENETYGRGENSFLLNIGLVPVYAYNNGENSITFNLKRKKINQMLMLLIVISAALTVGYVGRLIMPNDLLVSVTDMIFTPLEDAVFRMLSCIAGPMIFLSVAWGIYGIGDAYTFGRIGKKMMLSFLALVVVAGLFGSLSYPILGNALSASEVDNSQLATIIEMLLGVFPKNIFSPFVDGNTLQVIFLGFIIGLSMIFLGQRTSSVARAIEQINYIINFLMSFISGIIPYFVFIVLVRFIWSDNIKYFAKLWQFVLIDLAVMFAFDILFFIYVSIKNKISLIYLLKSTLPSYLIALTTASSAAAFETNISICKNKLGIDKSMTSFGIPFGMVICKPNTAVFYICICFYFSKTYNVSVSLSWIIIAIIITTISAVSSPPIPGGDIAVFTVLFLQLGIPAEALSVAIAADILFDFFNTSSEMICLLFELFNISGRLGMRDDKKLKENLRGKLRNGI